MRGTIINAAGFTVLGLLLLSGATGGAKADTPQNIECRLDTVGLDPLPYQAVRLRIRVHNKSQTDFGPVMIMPYHSEVHFATKQGVAGRPPRWNHGFLPFDAAFHLRSATYKWTTWESNARVILKPGESISLSLLRGGNYENYPQSNLESYVPRLHPIQTLFAQPGNYYVQCRVPANFKRNLSTDPKAKDIGSLSIRATITVREPQGQDKECLDFLKRDARLVSALLGPINVPEEDQLPTLRQMILEYPRSSYIPYARFALARYYYARKASKAEREKAIALLRELLEPVRPHFAYEPYAIAALLHLDPSSHAQYIPIMDREYCDAMEWLGESLGDKVGAVPYESLQIYKRRELPLPKRRWEDYRKRVPVDRWTAPPGQGK